MFINHDNAKKTFKKITQTKSEDYIIIAGGTLSGKSSFIKEVCPSNKTLFCEPKPLSFYLDAITPYIIADIQNLIKNFLSVSSDLINEIKKTYNIEYENDITSENCKEIITFFIQKDIKCKTYKYARFLGKNLGKQYNYIVLDDFCNCDVSSYEWILSFFDSLPQSNKYIIAICDFDTCWVSKEIRDKFECFPNLINIHKFDASTDYFDVLFQKIYFDNIENLRKLANNLFILYEGDAKLLFKTIKIYENSQTKNDDERKKILLGIANKLITNEMQYNNKFEQLILELLALCPISLSLKDISLILEIEEKFTSKIITAYYNQNFIKMINKENKVELFYKLSDEIIKELILTSITLDTKSFILNRILILSRMDVIELPIEEQLKIALEIMDNSSEQLLENFIKENGSSISDEKKITYIDKIYSLKLNYNNTFSSINNAKMAYEFGYLHTANEILLYIQNKDEKLDYPFYMLLGGVQHLLLLKQAPKTFEIASLLPNITISEKLNAINRQIMSLNQADSSSEAVAKELYINTLKQYSNEKCEGLIALYRNTNNSFPMDEALEYTIKAYNLAVELGNELEQYKCVHNICMIRLHQGKYPQPLHHEKLEIEPTFEMVDKYFQSNPCYYHKRAYPLLDMGTYEMFQYIAEKKFTYLKNAKVYYSKAQLWAKTFYASHIAEMGLLIVNTYMYRECEELKNSLINSRLNLYQKYSKENIVDCRVNRKILLSFSTSAILSEDFVEAKSYLDEASKYISGSETERYKNLCNLCNGVPSHEIKVSNVYYGSPEFVPWLISLGH